MLTASQVAFARNSADITSAILSFTTARTIGTYTFPDNIRFIVAGNDKGNIQALDSASISRFAQFTLIPSAAAWMAHEPNLNPYIEKVLKANPSYIFCKESGIVTSTVQDDDGDSYDAEYEEFDDAAEDIDQEEVVKKQRSKSKPLSTQSTVPESSDSVDSDEMQGYRLFYKETEWENL